MPIAVDSVEGSHCTGRLLVGTVRDGPGVSWLPARVLHRQPVLLRWNLLDHLRDRGLRIRLLGLWSKLLCADAVLQHRRGLPQLLLHLLFR